jgi:hypothetical protein
VIAGGAIDLDEVTLPKILNRRCVEGSIPASNAPVIEGKSVQAASSTSTANALRDWGRLPARVAAARAEI